MVSEHACLITLTESALSNQLGGSTIAVTRDRKLVYVRQAQTEENPGRLAPAGSGSFDYRDLKRYLKKQKKKQNEPTIQQLMRNGIERELKEECSAKVGRHDSKTILVGFARLLYRGGKPESFGLTLLNQERNDLRVRPREWGYIDKNEIKTVDLEGFERENVIHGLERILNVCSDEDASLPLYLNALFAKEFLENCDSEIVSDFYKPS